MHPSPLWIYSHIFEYPKWAFHGELDHPVYAAYGVIPQYRCDVGRTQLLGNGVGDGIGGA
jgi:hypothetical protein